MVLVAGVGGRTGERRRGEVRLNTSPNPSRRAEAAGRVSDVPAPAKRPPLVIVLAVAIPLLAIAVAAIVRTTTADDDASTATTLVQDGAPGADPGDDGADAGGPAGEDAAATPSKDGAPTTTTTRSGGEADDAEGEGQPTPPAAAGAEGERPTVTYPPPTVPASGCSRPSGTAVITLGSSPSPACLELAADQAVVFRNRTGKDISVVAIGLNEVVAAGTEARVGAARDAFGDGRSTFWSPGNPQLSGIVEVS